MAMQRYADGENVIVMADGDYDDYDDDNWLMNQ